jgi:CCR4-NOT transcriptional regulation complex NOT5 subunit
METFKVVERESKLKAYSKEALSKAHQLKIKKKKKGQKEEDPNKAEIKEKLNENIDTLQEQLSAVEEELDSVKDKHKKTQK